MKHLYKIPLAALAALLASACGNDTETDKTEIAVESLRTTVTSDSHQAEIRYEIRNAAPDLRVAARHPSTLPSTSCPSRSRQPSRR